MTTTCDVCGRIKGDANHWWTFQYSDLDGELTITVRDGSSATYNELDICSPGCLAKQMDKALTEWRNRPIPVAEEPTCPP